MIKQCEICGKDFTPKASNQVYCCAECRKASHRSATMRFCEICGATISGKTAKYCDKCKAIAYREKRHERYAKQAYEAKGQIAKHGSGYTRNRAHCRKCKYYGSITGTCDYILHTEMPRGCKAEDCTKWRETR